MQPRYRCRHDIAAAILESIMDKGGMKISHIAIHSRLPLDRAKKIIRDMVEHGLVYFDPVSETYSLSHLGIEWLYLYKRLEEVYTPPSSTPEKSIRRKDRSG